MDSRFRGNDRGGGGNDTPHHLRPLPVTFAKARVQRFYILFWAALEGGLREKIIIFDKDEDMIEPSVSKRNLETYRFFEFLATFFCF